MELEVIIGVMVLNIKALSLKTRYLGQENIHGKMVEYIQVNGWIIKCMELAFLSLLMVVNMKEHTSWTPNRAMEYILIRTGSSSMETG